MAERKNPQLDAEHQAILRKMMLLAENRTCADCKGPSPRWASTNLGIFICITCSGIHRKLGTHISQVRSITLDTWTPSQIQHFRKFGNAKAADYFEACLPSDFRRPHSADSMQMERFIRDKYENKRYITVENGGLGGQAVGRNRPSRTTQRPNTGSLGPRPTQTLSALHQAAYDATPTVRKTGVSSMSYGGRFSRPVKPMHLPQRTTSTGASFSSSTGSANAMQSASTLKQLLTMGFAQDIAVKAIEAGDGDLQRSLDWILQHDGKPPSQAPAASIIRPRQVQKDLLDFDEPQSSTAASAPAHQPSAPKTMATESLISSTMTDSSTKSMTNSGFADFANFGELQRALPSAVQPKQQSVASHVSVGTPSTPKNAALTSSLASLYKKSPQKPTTAPYHIPSFSKSVSPTHFVASSFQTAGKTTETHANEDSLGLTTFESLSPQNLRLSGKTVPSISLAGKDEQPGVQASQKSVPSCEPPPLPPPDDFLFPDSFGKQPLPSSPKDTSDTRAPPAAKQDIKHEKLEGTNSLSMEKKEESPESEPNVTKNEQKEEEEEDPFAALSMMALNSATKTQQKKEKASTLPKAKASEPRLSQASEGVQSSINLDELLS